MRLLQTKRESFRIKTSITQTKENIDSFSKLIAICIIITVATMQLSGHGRSKLAAVDDVVRTVTRRKYQTFIKHSNNRRTFTPAPPGRVKVVCVVKIKLSFYGLILL